MYFFVCKNDFEKLEVGQKVKVWYEDTAMESLPHKLVQKNKSA
jgi:hypothetical protein